MSDSSSRMSSSSSRGSSKSSNRSIANRKNVRSISERSISISSRHTTTSRGGNNSSSSIIGRNNVRSSERSSSISSRNTTTTSRGSNDSSNNSSIGSRNNSSRSNATANNYPDLTEVPMDAALYSVVTEIREMNQSTNMALYRLQEIRRAVRDIAEKDNEEVLHPTNLELNIDTVENTLDYLKVKLKSKMKKLFLMEKDIKLTTTKRRREEDEGTQRATTATVQLSWRGMALLASVFALFTGGVALYIALLWQSRESPVPIY